MQQAHKTEDYLRLDEYLDIGARRSSIRIYDAQSDSTEIHYNKLNSNDLGPRRSIVYRPALRSCETQIINDWQFADLRRVAIYFYPPIRLMSEYIDVPIGPSVLVFAVHHNTNQFKFVKTLYSKSLMASVNVYEVRLDYNAFNGIFRRLKIVLHVDTVGQRRSLSAGDTLASALLDKSRLSIKFFGACKLDGSAESRLKRQPTETPTTTEADGYKARGDVETDEWNENKFCSSEKGGSLLFKIHYDIIEEHQPDSLVGDQLDGLSHTREYDFFKEPLMQPVGIGCWSTDTNPSWRNSLIDTTSAANVSMSASYVTLNGFVGQSFVAYDQVTHLLRLDQEGRKNIYDLISGRSYHSGLLSSSSELGSTLASVLSVDKCTVLTMSPSSGPIDADGNILEQLIGLGGPNVPHYMGTRSIEHEQFEVYELMVDKPDKAPLLLRTKFYKLHDETFKLFVTYYVRAPNLLRYIELYRYIDKYRRHELINRLEFVDFSWSLEVEPADDTQSQTSGEPIVRLFKSDACQQSSAGQAELVVAFERTAEIGQIGADQLTAGLMQNKQELIGHIQRTLTDTLQISSLNIADLKLSVSSSQAVGAHHLLATSKIVDLRSGFSQLKLLGMFNYFVHDWGTLEEYREARMRYSLNECVLDSISYPKANWFAQCPGLDACVIYEPNESHISGLASNSILTDKHYLCYLYSVKYATTDKSMRSVSALERVDINLRRLQGQQFEFELGSYKHPTTGELVWGHTYRATMKLHHYKLLDSLSAQLAGAGGTQAMGLAALSGLRYSSADEEPGTYNQRVALELDGPVAAANGGAATSKLTAFNHCQLSCQLDEFCGSFSFCSAAAKRGPSPSPARTHDCVLSSLRLTSSRIASLADGARKVKRDESKFRLSITSELLSQTFVMHKDGACSLHPRNFAHDYRPIRSVSRVSGAHERRLAEALERGRARGEMTFDDCAGLSFERNFASVLMRQTNFTYCPLDSLCIVGGDNVAEQTALADDVCIVFERRATWAYADMRSTHMQVTLSPARAPKLPDSNDNAPGAATAGQTDSVMGPVFRTFLGASEEDCARDCSLHRSECLAFDSCLNYGMVICILYSVRSPLATTGAYLPALERERKLLERAEIKLVGNPRCSHFHLKPAYFEVRLKSLLARQASGGAARLPEELSKLEERIEANNERISDEQVRSIEAELELDKNEPSTSGGGESSAGGGWLKSTELLLGIFIGCALVAFQQEVGAAVLAVYRRLRPRQSEPDEGRLVHDEPL
jgi:hypothetical protein